MAVRRSTYLPFCEASSRFYSNYFVPKASAAGVTRLRGYFSSPCACRLLFNRVLPTTGRLVLARVGSWAFLVCEGIEANARLLLARIAVFSKRSFGSTVETVRGWCVHYGIASTARRPKRAMRSRLTISVLGFSIKPNTRYILETRTKLGRIKHRGLVLRVFVAAPRPAVPRPAWPTILHIHCPTFSVRHADRHSTVARLKLHSYLAPHSSLSPVRSFLPMPLGVPPNHKKKLSRFPLLDIWAETPSETLACNDRPTVRTDQHPNDRG